MLLDIPPLDPKLPFSVEAKVQALCDALDPERPAPDHLDAPGDRETDLLRASGLLNLAVPAQFGGKGASWGTTFGIIRRLAKANSSVAERFASQYLQIGTIQLLGTHEQQGNLLFGTAHHDWVWGSAIHASSSGVFASVSAGELHVSGIPTIHSCVEGADRLILSAYTSDGSGLVFAAVDAFRAGIVRRVERKPAGGATEALRVIEFRRMAVSADEVLGGILGNPEPRSALQSVCHLDDS